MKKTGGKSGKVEQGLKYRRGPEEEAENTCRETEIPERRQQAGIYKTENTEGAETNGRIQVEGSGHYPER